MRLEMASSWEFGECSIEGISNQSAHQVNDNVTRLPTAYLGETIKYEIVIRRSKAVDALQWKDIVSKMSCQVQLVPLEDSCNFCTWGSKSKPRPVAQTQNTHSHQSEQGQGEHENETPCSLLSTFTGNAVTSLQEQDSKSNPYFKDEDTFVFPMSSSLHGLIGHFHFVELQVTLALFGLNAGKWQTLSNKQGAEQEVDDEESGEEIDLFEEMGKKSSSSSQAVVNKRSVSANDAAVETKENKSGKDTVQESSGIHSVMEKTVTQRIKVQSSPSLRLRLATAGQKQFLLLTVGNKTERQMVVKSMDLLSVLSSFEGKVAAFEEGSVTKWEGCHHLVSLEHPKKNTAFPAIVCPLEELSLIYKLHLSSLISDTDLSLRCGIKWTHAGASKEITTIFKLPPIKVRHPLFIVTVKCEDEPVIHETFSVTYSISNQLYDFMSMKVYYNVDNLVRAVVDKGSDACDEDRLKLNQLKEAVVCHDPIIHTSSCPKGSSIPVTVSFQIHQPGLYEMSELMKVNLGYSLFESSPDHNSSRSVSSDTMSSSPSTEEHLLASHQLWQNRSGSSTSLINPVLNPTTDEKRKNFANKSYSFGDLGPSGGSSSDVHEGHGNRPKTFKRSSAVLPARPPPPRKLSQAEQDLINPSNFLKKPFYIYIKEPTV